jgi:protein ImuB
MFACVHLPRFFLQAALRWHEHRGAAVVVDDEGVVLEACARAEAAGIFPGMTAPQAMARDGAVLVRQRSPAQEECLNELLVEFAFALSPDVELTRAGTCVADVSAAPRGTCWQRLAEGRIAHLHDCGLEALAGVAPTPDLAELAARGATPTAVVYDAPAFVKALPLAALEPSGDIAAILREWGIRDIGGFLSLPRAESIARLGPEAERLMRKVSARNKRPLRRVRRAAKYAEAFDFDYEVETVEPLLFLSRRFLNELCGRLREVHRVTRRMEMRLTLENGTLHERSFSVPSPTAEVDVLFRILDTHFEGLHLEQRPTAMRLELEPAESEKSQFLLFESALRDPNRFGETMAKLKAFLGNDRVGVPQQGNSHRPDHFTLSDEFTPSESRVPMLGLPLRRFRPPTGGVVRVKDARPVHLLSARAAGEIRECAGPYRSSGDWWEVRGWSTEEWDVMLEEGGMYRLSLRGGVWSVEGCYEVC